MNVILLGPPGAGKGTQAKRLKDAMNMEIISTGDILRSEIAKATPLGLKVKDIVEAGKFPSDELIMDLLKSRLVELGSDQGVILDGVPRTLHQAEMLGPLFQGLGRTLNHVIELTVDIDALVERLSSRYMCAACGAIYSTTVKPAVEGTCDRCGGHDFTRREDDKPEAIKERFNVYREQTEPLLDYYGARNCLKSVDGMQTPDQVHQQIKMIAS